MLFRSVRDNLIVAAQEFKGTLRSRLFAAPDAGLGKHADQMIELFRLQPVAQLPAGSLSYGQQKLIDIAMAFMPAPFGPMRSVISPSRAVKLSSFRMVSVGE